MLWCIWHCFIFLYGLGKDWIRIFRCQLVFMAISAECLTLAYEIYFFHKRCQVLEEYLYLRGGQSLALVG